MNPHHRFSLLIALLVMTAGAAFATAPQLVTYQGRLTNALGTPLPNGTYTVSFAIYDAPTAGNLRWTETHEVTTTDGLFSVVLGDSAPLEAYDLRDTASYLGLAVDYGSELTPRTRLTSAPFALSASEVFAKANGIGRVLLRYIPSNASALILASASGLAQSTLRQLDGQGGELYLSRDDGTTYRAISLSTYRSDIGSHAHLSLRNWTGDEKVFLDADDTGDDAAILPDSSISKTEICDEPGIAINYNTSTVVLTGTVEDIVTTSILAPGDGCVHVIGKGTAYLSGTTGTNFGYAQIDATSGGAIVNPYKTVFGSLAMGTTQQTFFPFTVTRVYPVDAGQSLDLRLEGCFGGSQSAGAIVDVRNATIEATFIPSVYGAGPALFSADEAARFENAVPVNVDGQTLYRVDLRELELKAARERAEAAEAEAALERARREEAEKQFQELSGK